MLQQIVIGGNLLVWVADVRERELDSKELVDLLIDIYKRRLGQSIRRNGGLTGINVSQIKTCHLINWQSQKR